MKVYILLIALAVLAVASEAKEPTDCEKHRDNAEKHKTIMKLIPECDADGNYKPLQCYKDSPFCVCYDKEGKPISPISSKIRKCGCHAKRHEKANRGHDNAFIPQCEEDGSFSKKQIWDFNNSCWCVDENGNQKGDIKSNCDALQCD